MSQSLNSNSSNNNVKKIKKLFDDSKHFSLCETSSWLKQQQTIPKKSVGLQTEDYLYEKQDCEVQTGRYNVVKQSQIDSGTAKSNTLLLDYLTNKYKDISREKWEENIKDGRVTVDFSVCLDPLAALEEDFYVEYVGNKGNMSTQTEVLDIPKSSGEGKESEEKEQDIPSDILPFLRRISTPLFKILDENNNTKAFDAIHLYNTGLGEEGESESVTYWKGLSVDLEKKRVVYPDWTTARYFTGTIVNRTVTRNKERIYDIEYEDGGTLQGVKEEFIRLLSEESYASNRGGRKGADQGEKSNQTISGSALSGRLQEGIRVHAKVSVKGGSKYLPGRIIKVGKSVFDVECEGNRIETGLTVNDLLIGLSTGMQVEARRPSKVHLQCTSMSFNSTGSMVAATYGRNDLTGWCNYPGALCIWNIYAKTTQEGVELNSPEFVLDHQSCLMSACYHPIIPSLIAVGSFNGEVLVWDLTNTEQPLAISSIIEFAHKEPVSDLRWYLKGGNPADISSWLLVSGGADGRLLFWSLSNKFQFPVKGIVLGRGKASIRRQYPLSHGISSLSFSETGSSSSSAKSNWIVIGQEGGCITRTQLSRLLSSNISAADVTKSSPDEIFLPIKSKEDNFRPQPHVGAVSSVDWSPFHRNLYITGGTDGVVKLFHVLLQDPIKKWEPTPSSTGDDSADYNSHRTNSSQQFVSITAAKFSPSRPMVFAVGTSDGRIYIYDLLRSSSLPCTVLEVQAQMTAPTAGPGATKVGKNSQQQKRIAVTGLSFNAKRRDILAATDWLGRVHVWKLNWKLCAKQKDELSALDNLGNIRSGEDSIHHT